ncbi:MAG: ABC transporter permease subunit, partial [Chloroflexota bacterium]|nr:ABC transporter permease subunit [Chloroflexota bacterium]
AFYRGFLHLLKKGLLISLTIFLGVFITVTIMNRTVRVGFGFSEAQLDATIENQIDRTIDLYIRENPSVRHLPYFEREAAVEWLYEELVEEFGLNLPKFQRHLLWTLKALKLDWGRLRVGEVNPFPVIGWRPVKFDLNQELLLSYLPNTMLLAGSAFFLVFMFGLPLSLMLARNYGKWFDRVISFFSPLSSIPSWVIGILLIWLFAFELGILPAGRMYDSMPPETRWGYIPVILKHMALPVFSIALSLFFQLVYSWRTFFITFSSEDYVELGKAKGLSNRILERKYILRPSLAYIITSFSLLFVSFWQMTIALEVVFNWPGLGWLYVVKGLPNLWGENIYPGDLLISITLVVMFAYLMGAVVLLLDFVYVLVDPRVTIGHKDVTLRLKRRRQALWKSIKEIFHRREPRQSIVHRWQKPDVDRVNNNNKFNNGQFRLLRAQLWRGIKNMAREIRRYPSAIIGFIIILLLILGSLYAVIFLPYEKIGGDWERSNLSGQSRIPQLAKPAWVNWFREKDYLSILELNSEEGEGEKIITPVSEDVDKISITFNFDYDYVDFPKEVFLYFNTKYVDKRPFASVLWKTPDGREIELKALAVGTDAKYDFEESIPANNLLTDDFKFEMWFDPLDTSFHAFHDLLFANPESDQAEILPGQYQLVIEGVTFEADRDLDADLVILGQVYGVAGTDFYRRDLVVPLLWGIPYALLIGLLGALSTTIISMIFAATGVWFGGWMDNLVQRLIDVNLVLPILAIAVMAYAFLDIDIVTILVVYIILSAFGTPTKNFRAAFLQIKEAPYIEAAKAYGASNMRIILRYMVPRLIPVLIPQLVILIPSFVFLEATLGFFNIKMIYPTWGTVIYQATMHSGLFFSRYWVLQPIVLLLLTGLGFSLFGFALERILNPRLKSE